MNRRLPLTPGEKLILSKSTLVSYSQRDFSWLDSADFDEFVSAWDVLAEEFKAGDRTVISVEMVSNYLAWNESLRRVSDTTLAETRREQAHAALKRMENAMFAIEREASRSLNTLED